MAATGGCLFGGGTTIKRTGTDVPRAAFDEIQPGTTTLAWVHATLGEPSAKEKPEPHDEVWRYDYTEHVDSNGYVLFVFGGTNSTETTRKAVVEFKDGVVVRKWRG